MVHSGVWKEIKTVCRRTGLAEEAGNPRSLYRLYLSTYRELCVGPANETELRCRRLLEAEETSVAWNV